MGIPTIRKVGDMLREARRINGHVELLMHFEGTNGASDATEEVIHSYKRLEVPTHELHEIVGRTIQTQGPKSWELRVVEP